MSVWRSRQRKQREQRRFFGVRTIFFGLLSFFIIFFPAVALSAPSAQSASPDCQTPEHRGPSIAGPCGGKGNCIIVDTALHLLWICQDGRNIEKFRVALGRGGVDKTRRGDDKTPIGSYYLGSPRPSPRFGTFIPIGYPTPKQRAEGYSGGDVGVHGPSHIYRWFENIHNDWTLGCIAVRSGGDISAIARWVRRHRGSRILIRREIN